MSISTHHAIINELQNKFKIQPNQSETTAAPKAKDLVSHSVKESKDTQKALLSDLNARFKQKTISSVQCVATHKVSKASPACLLEGDATVLQTAFESFKAFQPEKNGLTPSKKTGGSCIEEQSLVGLQAAARRVTACQNKEKHGVFLAKNALNMVDMGEALLKNLYAMEDPAKLSCNGEFDKLPSWLRYVDERLNFFNYFALLSETERTNNIFASAASMINKLNIVSKAQCGLPKLNPFSDAKTLDEHARLRKHYLSAILCMMWALYAKTAAENRDFLRGSYKIVDPDLRLYHCLLEYVKFATKSSNPTGILPYGLFLAQKIANPTCLLNASSAFAYGRSPNAIPPLSSHYPQDPEQWGIDMRFGEEDLAIPLLPGKACHILFGVVKGNQTKGYPRSTFIKFEPDPLGNAIEVLAHGASFIQSHHVEMDAKREKDIDPELIKIFDEFTKQCPSIIIKKGKHPIHTMGKIMDEAIAALESNKEKTKANEERQAELMRFKQRFISVATIKGLGYLDIRTGNEEVVDLVSYKPTHAAAEAGIVHSPIRL